MSFASTRVLRCPNAATAALPAPCPEHRYRWPLDRHALPAASRLLQPPVRPFLLRIALRNLLGNIVLFIPLGYFLPAISASLRKFYLTFLSVTIIITTVELAQLVFMVGTCDIDDLILNLLGASMGYGLYRLTNRG